MYAQLFLGIAISAELRMHMNYSLPWKQAQITRDDSDLPQQVHFEGGNYLGFFLPDAAYSTAQLQAHAQRLLHKIAYYFPKYSKKALPIVLFPQLFIP